MKFLLACCVIFSFFVAEPGRAASDIKVTDVWARAMAPGQTTAGVYFDAVSAQNAAIVAATTPVADKAELHTMSMAGGVMRMRPVEKIDLPANRPVQLAPGGVHVMLTGVKRPLKEGDRVPLTLTIRPADGPPFTYKVEAEVRPLGAQPMHMHH